MVPFVLTILAAAACCLPKGQPAVETAALEKPFRDISISSGINLTGRGRGSAW
ncbi:MAG: hypothetical protein FD129_1006, partial [bacterium]